MRLPLTFLPIPATQLTMGYTETKATLIFHYVAQPRPNPRAKGRTEVGIISMQCSGYVMHVSCYNCKQHPRAAGPDVAHHLHRGYVDKVWAPWHVPNPSNLRVPPREPAL